MLLSTKAVAFQVDAAAPVKSYHEELGEISSYPPGYKENAGIFCHNNPWVSCAETVVGHGDRALEIYQKTCPAYIEDKIKAGLSGMNAFRRGPLFKSMLNLQLRSFILVIFSYKSSFLRESSFIHRALCCRCTKCRPGPDILTFA